MEVQQQIAQEAVEQVTIELTDLLKRHKGISEDAFRASNWYYSEYGVEYSVENLAWSADRILKTCEEPLRNKIQGGIVGVSPMESGGGY